MNYKKDKEGNIIYPITHALVFPAVMEDPVICGEFLEFVLGEYNLGLDFSNLSKETIKSEETFVTVRTKSTRIDIFIDEKEYKANLEMQNQRKKGYFLPKRSKYHHMEMTRIQLDPSASYDELKPTIVIFICMYDEFGCNLPKYTVRMKVEEDDSIDYDDGTITVIMNMAYKGDNLPQNVEEVYEYFRNGIFPHENEMVHRIDDRVREVNIIRKESLMTYEEALRWDAEALAEEIAKDKAKDIAKDMAKDMAQGIAQEIAHSNKIEIVQRMLDKGLDVLDIADFTDISVDEIEALKNRLDGINE